MIISPKVPDKGDPSDVLQTFPNYNIQLHCCRYWWLQRWEFKELSFPYWRIYHNSRPGAAVIYNGREYTLTPDKIIMIAPNTSYATRLFNHIIPKTGYSLKGGRIHSSLSEDHLRNKKNIPHLFIHFNIGMPYDNISPGVFIYELTDHIKEKLQIIIRYLNYEYARFSFYSSIAIQSLISDLLSGMPEESWNLITKDKRILDVLSHVEDNMSNKLNNSTLAEQAKMATNAFARLFAEETGVSPQKYIRRKRVNKACILLHHYNLSIDEVAIQTGFSDRYHFSRIFKEITGISPARYKREFKIK